MPIPSRVADGSAALFPRPPNLFRENNGLRNLADGLPLLPALLLQGKVRTFFIKMQFALQDPFRAIHELSHLESIGEQHPFAFQARHLQFRADQKTDHGDQPHLAGAVMMRFAMLHIDHAHQLAAAQYRHGEKRFKMIFRQIVEHLETGITPRLRADSHGPLMHGDPAGNSLAQLQIEFVHQVSMGIF